jgi:putative RecB family exonuclease
MDIQELRKRPHLSASSIGTYIECGLLYKLSRIDKLEPEGRADALELGSVIHEALAHFNRQRMLGVVPSLDELTDKFDELWRCAAEANEEIRYKQGKDFESLLEQGKELLRVYHKNRSEDGFNVIGIEEPFRFEVGGIPIIGVFDLVEEDTSGGLIIVDFKTSSKAYSGNDVDNSFQMTLYHMAAKANGCGHREILLRFDCLIKTKRPKFEQYYTVRSDVDEQRARKTIREVWRGIQAGIFIPNDTSWKCPGCAYKAYCDQWFEKEGS